MILDSKSKTCVPTCLDFQLFEGGESREIRVVPHGDSISLAAKMQDLFEKIDGKDDLPKIPGIKYLTSVDFKCSDGCTSHLCIDFLEDGWIVFATDTDVMVFFDYLYELWRSHELLLAACGVMA